VIREGYESIIHGVTQKNVLEKDNQKTMKFGHITVCG
jgi:hypothetical protein